MKRYDCGKHIMAVVTAALLTTGCAHYPISKQVWLQARRDVTFNMVFKDPAAYIGSTVIWGGIIVATENTPEATELTILQTPLSGDQKPKSSRYSTGRFIARTSQFLDPAIYKENAKVTIAGVVEGREARPLGKLQYAYPIITIKEIYLWRKTRTVYYYGPDMYWWYYPWGWGGGYYEEYDDWY